MNRANREKTGSVVVRHEARDSVLCVAVDSSWLRNPFGTIQKCFVLPLLQTMLNVQLLIRLAGWLDG